MGIVRDENPAADQASSIPLTAEVVFEERLVACLPIGHPLAQRNEEIVEVPMISYPRLLMPGFVDRVAEALSAAPHAANVIEEGVHQETALGFVAAGVGASILPESVRQLIPTSIAVVPLSGAPTTRLLAVRQTRAAGDVRGTVFIECLRDAAASSRMLNGSQTSKRSPGPLASTEQRRMSRPARD